MSESYSLVINKGEESDAEVFVWSEPVFFMNNNHALHCGQEGDEVLRYLVFSIRQQPKNLLKHLQRIIFCYEKRDQQRLYAALSDFFIILQSAGRALKIRMLGGSKKQLPDDLFNRLQLSVDNKQDIIGNKFSVLTTGVESNTESLIIINDSLDNNSVDNYDPVQIARDFVEFSQLDEAIKLLETAVLENPERDEIHRDLLELYQSTRDVDAFNKMKVSLAHITHSMQDEWDKLNIYFNQ